MFAKLLKYDMRALKKTGVPILISLLAFTVLASVIGYFLMGYLDSSFNSTTTTELQGILTTFASLFFFLGLMLSVVLFSGAATVMLVLVCVHFYKNTVSDEGYLTFTLPVKTSEIIFSKLLSGFTWTSVISIASVIGMVIVFFGSMLGNGAVSDAFAELGDVLPMVPDAVKELMKEELNGAILGVIFLIIQGVLSLIVMSVFNLLLTYTAIFFGGVITKKNKGIAAVGCVIGANTLLSLFSSIFSMVLMPLMFAVDSFGDMITSYNINLFVTNLVYGGVAVGCYFLLKHMMDKKLNLN